MKTPEERAKEAGQKAYDLWHNRQTYSEGYLAGWNEAQANCPQWVKVDGKQKIYEIYWITNGERVMQGYYMDGIDCWEKNSDSSCLSEDFIVTHYMEYIVPQPPSNK